ncbi:hypothetical protein HDU96_004783, partial [Phlyctochytrium bullatum]
QRNPKIHGALDLLKKVSDYVKNKLEKGKLPLRQPLGENDDDDCNDDSGDDENVFAVDNDHGEVDNAGDVESDYREMNVDPSHQAVVNGEINVEPSSEQEDR